MTVLMAVEENTHTNSDKISQDITWKRIIHHTDSVVWHKISDGYPARVLEIGQTLSYCIRMC